MSINLTWEKASKGNRVGGFREFWDNYGTEVLFGLALGFCVLLSTYLSRFIPDALYDNILTPIFNVATVSVGLGCAWVVFRHTDGMRMRRAWGYALVVWGLCDLAYLIGWLVAPLEVMNMGATRLSTHELFLGNLLGWVLTLYPTETLRPGWMSPKVALLQLLPLVVLAALDYVTPLSLWPVIALYPYLLLALVLRQIRAYRKWCEDNYSSMENIDVPWIIRYCVMLFILGANYVYMCATHDHTRGFTQQWFVVFMLAHSTEQILFRKDPWSEMKSSIFKVRPSLPGSEEESEMIAVPAQVSDREKLEEWMATKRPYLNPDFQLIDLRAVLQTNRTYLSRFIHDEYGCSFYQFANRYRVEEAKRVLRETPDIRLTEVAERSGFNSSSVFSRIFSRETGISPTEWMRRSCENRED